jgi:hypothetical protein
MANIIIGLSIDHIYPNAESWYFSRKSATASSRTMLMYFFRFPVDRGGVVVVSKTEKYLV